MFDENHTDFDLDDELLNSFQNSKTTTTENTKFLKPKQVVKRKFPGPAGILPDCKNVDLSVLYDDSNRENNQISTNEIPCSQSSITVFQDDLWLRVVNDYKQYTNEYCIDWIKNHANCNELINQKAPFLAAIIENLEYFEEKAAIVNILLKDPTGTIHGTMMNKLYEQYSECLSIGAVIILKQFGVLTTGTNNNHYLTITPKNLVGVYWKNKSDNNIKTVLIQDLSVVDDNIRKDRGRKRFNFKKINDNSNNKRQKLENTTITNSEHSTIWNDVFEGVDTDVLFDDF